jgi:L-malate glycosyltransferase
VSDRRISSAAPESIESAGGLRVAHVVLDLAAGGTQRLVIEMVKRSPAGIRPLVFCLDGPGEWAGELIDAGVPVESLHRQPGFRPALGWRLAALRRRYGVHVFHCHQYSPYVYGVLAAVLSPGLRLVFTEHGRTSDGPPSPKRRSANRWLARWPQHVCAVSEHLRSFMLTEGFAPDRVRVVRNGVSAGPTPTEAERLEARQRMGLPPDAFVLGTAARLDPVKDLPVLVASLARVRASVARARLVLLGDGPERGRLEAAAASLGVRDAVCMPGHRTDLARLLPGFDAFLNSSITEGVSLTILEGMAAALPVVATRVGGTPEVVVDGETGLLVPPRDPEAMATAALWLADHSRRAKLGRAGRQRFERLFTFDRMFDQYVRLYRDEAA